ncbi:RidA family protein [Kribbella soli]|uniref:RidA family protein n=1 Tax=Kribbella soli TaxID=1124743 RepID=A0A4R0H9Q5_9ACTN|nr:RidA family protein [Kribbella soli]TCC06224.1 RidA family protein [Kribbella soli]
MTHTPGSGAPEPFGHYSPSTISPDGTIWVSAQLPVGGGVRTDSPVPDQARQAILQLLSIVEAAGGTVASIAKVTLYVTDIGDWDAVDAVFAEEFGTHRPARAVLQVAGLHHGFKVAADAVAWRVHR